MMKTSEPCLTHERFKTIRVGLVANLEAARVIWYGVCAIPLSGFRDP